MTTWTIAYRKPRANRFIRPTNFTGTWAQAKALAEVFIEANPELQVYYVPTREAELTGDRYSEDIGNVLVDSGRRVRIIDRDEVPVELIARVPVAELAQQRWENGDMLAEPEPALVQLAAERGFELRWVKGDMPFRVYGAGAHVLRMDFRRAADLREWLAGHPVAGEPESDAAAEQVRAWWERHGLHKVRGNIAAWVIAARDIDWTDAEIEHEARGFDPDATARSRARSLMSAGAES